jgi:hypothetical protein
MYFFSCSINEIKSNEKEKIKSKETAKENQIKIKRNYK